jgi:hypothetical protein
MFDAKEDFSDNEGDKNVNSTIRRRKLASASASAAALPTLATPTDCDRKALPSNPDKNDDVASTFVVVPEEETNKTFYLFTRFSIDTLNETPL